MRGCGYGVVIPGREEIQLEEPAVIHQGNKYGVKIKSVSPSIHMIKANIETEFYFQNCHVTFSFLSELLCSLL